MTKIRVSRCFLERSRWVKVCFYRIGKKPGPLDAPKTVVLKGWEQANSGQSRWQCFVGSGCPFCGISGTSWEFQEARIGGCVFMAIPHC